MLTLNASKYTPPGLPSVVHRSRLIDRLEKNTDKKVTLILGQAAQGKSTLAASYLHTSTIPSAWVHLGPEDSDPINFYYLMVHALQHILPAMDFSNYLETPQIVLGMREEISRCWERLESLTHQLPSPINIILDGLDNLPSDAPVYPLIESITLNTPAGVHVYLISRETPPIRLERFKMRQETLVITNEDLAFTLDEIGEFFRLNPKSALSRDQLEQIQRITGGWVGGLVLVADALGRVPDNELARYLRHGLPSEVRAETFSYFSEEIFSAQPERIRTFLTQTAILDVIDPGIAEELLDSGGEKILQELVRRNLFVETIYDEKKGRVFRYNQLFRDFLTAVFKSRNNRRTRIRLYQKAANLFWKRNRIEESLKFYLKAEDYDRAAASLKKIALDLSIRGRLVDLSRWIETLPAPMVRSDPWLFYYLTYTRRIGGGVRNIEDLQKIISMFTDAGDTRGHMLALASLIEAAVFLGHEPFALRQWIRDGEALLQSLGQNAHFTYARTVLWMQIGFGYISGGSNIQKGLSACRNAVLLAKKMKDAVLEVNAVIISVMGFTCAGEFSLAEEALEKIDYLVVHGAYPEYRALRNIVNIILFLRKGDFARSEAYMDIARKDIETFGLLFLYPTFIDACGFFKIYDGNFDEAAKICNHLTDVAVLSNNTYYQAMALRLSGLMHYHRGGYQEAAAVTARALDLLDMVTEKTLHTMRVKELMGLIHLHLDRFEAAEHNLRHALDYFRQAACRISEAETHLGLALLFKAGNDVQAVRVHLEKGLAIAAAHSYKQFIMLSPADLTQVCIQAVELEVEPVMSYAIRLLSACLPASDLPAFRAFSPGETEYMRGTSRLIRKTIHLSRRPSLDIRTLGGFIVRRDGKTPIAGRQWVGRKPKLLLKAILVHGAREIPKDILIEALWPESNPAAAGKNFKVTLHRLRKILEPDLNPEFGSAYVHLKGGRLSLNRRLCRIDAEEFLKLCKQIRRLEQTGDVETILGLCREAAALYEGDFLPEEPYAPWAEMKRAMLRDEYLKVLSKMVELHENRGEVESAIDGCRAILKTDPYLEKAIRRLMRLYADQGMRSTALKVYENFKFRIETEMDAVPDPATTDLYRRIQHHT